MCTFAIDRTSRVINLLSQNHFGFRKYRSTELAAVWFTDQIRRSMHAAMLTGAIYVDE